MVSGWVCRALLCVLVVLKGTYGKPGNVINGNSDNQNGSTLNGTDGKDMQNPENLTDLIDEEFRRLKIATADCEGRIATISKQIEEKPHEPLNYRDRGICYLIMSKFEEATIDFEQWAKIEPNNAVNALYLVNELSKVKDLEDFPGISPNEETKKAMLESGGENELLKALIRVREILEMREKEEKTGANKVDEGNVIDAVKDCQVNMSGMEKLLEQNGNEPLHYRNLGICHMIMGDFDSALAKFRKWLEIEPESGVVAFFMGEVSFEMENFDKAQEYYEKVLELSKNKKSVFGQEDSKAIDAMINMCQQKIEKIKHMKQKKPSSSDSKTTKE